MAKSFFKKIGNSAAANCCRWLDLLFFRTILSIDSLTVDEAFQISEFLRNPSLALCGGGENVKAVLVAIITQIVNDIVAATLSKNITFDNVGIIL